MGPLAILTAMFAFAIPTGRIVTEWDPGLTAAEAGGPLVVDDYGVNGLGAYRLALDDGTSLLAVCIEADVGHALSASYAPDSSVSVPPELAYLLWAYLAPGHPSDVEAAAVNILAWRATGAQRRGGGPVWRDGSVDVRALGVGHLAAVEAAVDALWAEAVARLGPWTLTPSGIGAVRLAGPAGPIGGIAVTFSAEGWRVDATTGDDGVAAVTVPAGVVDVAASAETPGEAIALVAPGSQRLAVPGPAIVLTTAVDVPPPPTTSTTTTTPTTSTSTTTLPPPTTTPLTTTIAPTTSSTFTTTTTITSTTTTLPPTTSPPTAPPVPPTLPHTGAATRPIARLASWMFATGALLVMAVGRRRVRQ